MNDLNQAVKREDRDEVKRLVSIGHQVNAPDEDGITPLMVAADRGNTAILRFLLDAGADPNVRCPGDWSPLARATAAGNHRAVVLLLKRGADPQLPFCSTTVATLVRNRWPERSDILELLDTRERDHDPPEV
jgi:ankyrin repeat protein